MPTLANLIKNIDPPAPDSVVLATENTTEDSIKFGVDQDGKMGYIAPGDSAVTPFQADIQADAVVLATENDTSDSIKFGFDSSGKMGYILPGADSVIPFKGFGDLEAAYNDGIAAARTEYIMYWVLGGGGSANGSYMYSNHTEFSKDYAQVFAVMMQDDSDDSGDNFMKAYSVDKGFTTGVAPAASYWTDTVDEWNYFKPTIIGGELGTNYGWSKTNSNKYSSTPNDYNKDTFRKLGNRYIHSCIAYKNDVKAGDELWCYGTHGTTVHVLGIPATGLEEYDGATEAETNIYQRGYNNAIANSSLELIQLNHVEWAVNNIEKESITFNSNYTQVIAIMLQVDTDDNGDNFMKVFSQDPGYTVGTTPSTDAWSGNKYEWNYYKPMPAVTTNIGKANTNGTHYDRVPKDYGKDIFHVTEGAYSISCIAYKTGVKAGDTAYVYATRGTMYYFLGLKTNMASEALDDYARGYTIGHDAGYAEGFDFGGPHTGYDVAGGTYAYAAAGTKTITVPYPGFYILTIADSAASSTKYSACTATGANGLTLTNMGAWNSNATETSASPTFASFTYYLVKSSGSNKTITMSYPEVTGSRVSRYRLIRIGTSGDGTSAYQQGYESGIAGATNLIKLFSTSHNQTETDTDYTYTFMDDYAYALIFVATGSNANDNSVSVTKTSGDGTITQLYAQPYWNSTSGLALQTNVYKITGITAGSVFEIVNYNHGGFAIFAPVDYKYYDEGGKTVIIETDTVSAPTAVKSGTTWGSSTRTYYSATLEVGTADWAIISLCNGGGSNVAWSGVESITSTSGTITLLRHDKKEVTGSNDTSSAAELYTYVIKDAENATVTITARGPLVAHVINPYDE